MKKLLCMLLAISMFAVVLTGCGGNSTPNNGSSASPGSSAAPDKTFLIKFGHVETADSNENKLALKFEELIEASSGGRIQVEVYPDGQLGEENPSVESVQMNAFQMTCPSAGALARFYAPYNIFMMPFYLPGANEMEKYNNLKAVVGTVFDDINKNLIKTANLRTFAPFWYGDRCISNNVKPITSASDLQGMNIRVPDQELYASVFKALGASPTPIAFTELYMALSQGVVDGQDNPAYTDYIKKFYEVQKYLTVTGHISQVNIPVMSEIFYQTLPSDLQQKVTDAILEACDYASKLQAQSNMDIVAELEKLGMEVSVADRDSFVEATKDIPAKLLDEESMKYFKTLTDALAANTKK